MTFSRTKRALAVPALMLFAAAPAFAADYLITLGVQRDIMLQEDDGILVDLGANRSYSCEGVPLDDGMTASEFGFNISAALQGGMSMETVEGEFKGTVSPSVGGEAGMGRDDNRVTLTPETSGRYRFNVDSVAMGGENIRIRCFATTLFGGFNTNVNDFNFLELTNIGNETIAAKVTATTFDGTVALNELEVSIPAGQRIDVDIHTTAGTDKFGTIVVTHDAPLGTLVGVVSQYFGTVDAFNLGGSQELVPFTQNQ